jgi:hypothetical protein
VQLQRRHLAANWFSVSSGTADEQLVAGGRCDGSLWEELWTEKMAPSTKTANVSVS